MELQVNGNCVSNGANTFMMMEVLKMAIGLFGENLIIHFKLLEDKLEFQVLKICKN